MTMLPTAPPGPSNKESCSCYCTQHRNSQLQVHNMHTAIYMYLSTRKQEWIWLFITTQAKLLIELVLLEQLY